MLMLASTYVALFCWRLLQLVPRAQRAPSLPLQLQSACIVCFRILMICAIIAVIIAVCFARLAFSVRVRAAIELTTRGLVAPH
jgi:hypothetical protein